MKKKRRHPIEPQPGTSTGGVTPSGTQVNNSTSTRKSARCAAKGQGRKAPRSDSSDTSLSDSSDSMDNEDGEWRPDTSSVPRTSGKTNNPSGEFKLNFFLPFICCIQEGTYRSTNLLCNGLYAQGSILYENKR